MQDDKKTVDSPDSGMISSGRHPSFWTDSVTPLGFQPLAGDLDEDVVIVGAGISGMTIAYLLAKAGRKVSVLEDGFIGSGETGRTTAHIVNALDDFYHELEKLHGRENAKLMADSHTAAIDLIENIVAEEKIDCDFRRVDGYLFLHPSDKIDTLEAEHDATHRVGITTEMIAQVPGMKGHAGPALRFPNQAQFHPMKYLHALAHAIIKRGGKIFTQTRVQQVKDTTLEANGHHVRARHLVVATNSPINDRFTMHTKQFAYRSYVIAARIPKGSVQPALWWDTGDHDSKWVSMPYNYVRVHESSPEYDLLIHGGQDHRTGQADTEDKTQQDRYDLLEKWLRSKFSMVGDIVYSWSGQVLEPVDAAAFIGRNPGDKEVYIVTGDSGNGMTHGTIAGLLISDLIMNKPNPWEKVYDPSRINLRSAKDFIVEVGNMMAQYADFVTPGDLPSAEALQRGEGAVIRSGLKKIAVFRDDAGQLHAYTAVCPHLGCIVQWNADEKSFDCPCHGSRFTAEGKLVNGPAVSDLAEVPIKQEA